MTILTRQERERLVLELYNLGKTYREISKEARISPRDIGIIPQSTMEMMMMGNKTSWPAVDNDNKDDDVMTALESFDEELKSAANASGMSIQL